MPHLRSSATSGMSHTTLAFYSHVCFFRRHTRRHTCFCPMHATAASPCPRHNLFSCHTCVLLLRSHFLLRTHLLLPHACYSYTVSLPQLYFLFFIFSFFLPHLRSSATFAFSATHTPAFAPCMLQQLYRVPAMVLCYIILFYILFSGHTCVLPPRSHFSATRDMSAFAPCMPQQLQHVPATIFCFPIHSLFLCCYALPSPDFSTFAHATSSAIIHIT